MARRQRRPPVFLAVFVGFVGSWATAEVAMGQSKGYVRLPRFAAEIVTLFVFTFVSLLERLFAAAG